ncbi:Protein of unknown function (DUF3151) [Frankia sp. EI5c]|uniref:DUF3151 domain-containing protein n=1 Tax=Frankia sp. EI5c TaxID=683316 RepID=UPI0007C3CF95|nr:DUF3151 domain-containing protein [Frankia sp. EI5c]OAA20685.1 Protein of unknown function (DUF3151) [Frankia sp. EI5c]OAA20730.1 Protein of unknown function (DUF3151) [Frankia sp. EI5c]
MTTPSANHNLLSGPPPTLLPAAPAVAEALASGAAPETVAARFPAASLGWAVLAEDALRAGQPVAAYAYARTGYHRGLDQLRRSGWKGHGPVPWSHEPNRGFLRALAALSRAAAEIGDEEEATRCRQFLADSDPVAVGETGLA